MTPAPLPHTHNMHTCINLYIYIYIYILSYPPFTCIREHTYQHTRVCTRAPSRPPGRTPLRPDEDERLKRRRHRGRAANRQRRRQRQRATTQVPDTAVTMSGGAHLQRIPRGVQRPNATVMPERDRKNNAEVVSQPKLNIPPNATATGYLRRNQHTTICERLKQSVPISAANVQTRATVSR